MSPLCTSVDPKEVPDGHGHDEGVIALVASPDGRWIASASHDQTVILWRVHRGPEGPAHIEVAVDWCTGQDTYKLQFSPDSRYIASLADTGEICIWGVPTGTLLGTLGGLGFEFTPETCMAWLQDGTLVVSDITTETKRLFCWYTVPSKERTGSSLTTPPSVVPPDAMYSLTDRGLVRLVDRHQPMETAREEFLEHSISPDGSLLAIPDADDTSVTMWDIDFNTPSPPRHMPLGLPTPGSSIEADPLIAVSDLATQKSFIGHRGEMWHSAIVDRVYSNVPVVQGGINLIDVDDREDVLQMGFSSCGRLFVTSMKLSFAVHLRRVSDGMRLATFNPPDHGRVIGSISWCVFTPDSQTLVCGDGLGAVYIRDIGHLDVLAEETATVAQ